MSRRMHILKTDGTAILELILQTQVIIKGVSANAHITFVTMDEIFHSADTADATFVTVEWFFGFVHP